MNQSPLPSPVAIPHLDANGRYHPAADTGAISPLIVKVPAVKARRVVVSVASPPSLTGYRQFAIDAGKPVRFVRAMSSIVLHCEGDQWPPDTPAAQYKETKIWSYGGKPHIASIHRAQLATSARRGFLLPNLPSRSPPQQTQDRGNC